MKEMHVKWREARRALQSIGLVLLGCFFAQFAVSDVAAYAQATGEAFCRSCHGDTLVDPHHELYGQPIPTPSAVPFPKPDVTAYDCFSCHKQELNPVTGALEFVPFRDCTVCHIDIDNAHHTNNPHAQAGDCMWCHVDSRPGFGPPDANIPTGQLACMQCHGSYKHNKGGPIQDFSVCFNCHAPVPFHAKPMATPECWKIMKNSPYYDPTLAPGKDSFNLFARDLQYQNSFWGSTQYGETYADRYCAPVSRSSFWNPKIPFNWEMIVDYLNNTGAWTVPTFEGTNYGPTDGTLGDTTGDTQPPPPQADSVNITNAAYDSYRDQLAVYATNSMGNNNASLSVVYRGNTYPMNWSSYRNRWEVTISTSTCESTVQVVSTAGGSATSNVTGCSSMPTTDTVNITRAEYDRSLDRLTVYAENSLGNNARLSVMYDGRSYDMNWNRDRNRWEVGISSSRCNDSTIEVVSSAGGSDSSSVMNCSSYRR